ncbi:ligand-gated channel [Tenacibaculum sp. KUL118]|nr:ligand-gated channel [Tenacibaculum sp. KUL118]
MALVVVSPQGYAQKTEPQTLERYTVTASRPYYDETLSHIFPQFEFDKRSLVAPLHTNEMLLQSPSVSLNGQGGQIQSISLRGYSRWRIQTLLDGVPIVSDRRAGSSIGFIPPNFISTVSVLPGAASTYLGSGALGGAVNLRLDAPQNSYVQGSYSSNQRMASMSYADSVATTDWNIAYRNAKTGSDAEDNTLFDQFEQTALFIRHRPTGGMIKEAWTLYSDNNDIGKSSSDYPENRISTYPDNRHWLGKLAFATHDISGNVWWHQSRLDTSVLRPFKRINDSSNEAFDYGFDVKGESEWHHWLVNLQFQVTGREGVLADEREFSLTSVPSELDTAMPNAKLAYEITTLDAREINTAGIVDASRKFKNTSFAVGARVDWQRQSDDTDINDTVTATNYSGYVGANYLLSSNLSASLYVSSAFRNPSLTERFFAGETPRGTVLGSTTLDTEQALNTQATLAYRSQQLQGTVELFYQKIDNYIERLTVSEDVLQYVNLDTATIKGASYQLSWQSENAMFDASLRGAWIIGEDDRGNTVADIPAHNQRIDIGINWNDARLFTVLAYRASKSDIADGERALDEVITLDMGAHWQVSEHIQLQASWTNLTNQHYYTSADDKAAFAQGQSVQLAFTYLL